MPPTNGSFPKAMRLCKPAEFAHAFKNGKRLRCDNFTITAVHNELSHPRLGLAISRKSAPRAVDRNRIKRVIRDSFRHRVDVITNTDVVVQASARAKTQSNAALNAKLDALWRRLR